jgi:hypothetical protein
MAMFFSNGDWSRKAVFWAIHGQNKKNKDAFLYQGYMRR